MAGHGGHEPDRSLRVRFIDHGASRDQRVDSRTNGSPDGRANKRELYPFRTGASAAALAPFATGQHDDATQRSADEGAIPQTIAAPCHLPDVAPGDLTDLAVHEDVDRCR